MSVTASKEQRSPRFRALCAVVSCHLTVDPLIDIIVSYAIGKFGSVWMNSNLISLSCFFTDLVVTWFTWDTRPGGFTIPDLLDPVVFGMRHAGGTSQLMLTYHSLIYMCDIHTREVKICSEEAVVGSPTIQQVYDVLGPSTSATGWMIPTKGSGDWIFIVKGQGIFEVNIEHVEPRQISNSSALCMCLGREKVTNRKSDSLIYFTQHNQSQIYRLEKRSFRDSV